MITELSSAFTRNAGHSARRHRRHWRCPPPRLVPRHRPLSRRTLQADLVLTCFMDGLNDRPLEPGERVIVSATRMEDQQAAEMDVEHCSSIQPTVELRMAGVWQHEDERRNRVRVRLDIRATRARHWVGGAWRDLEATLSDLSSRGVGLNLIHEVKWRSPFHCGAARRWQHRSTRDDRSPLRARPQPGSRGPS